MFKIPIFAQSFMFSGRKLWSYGWSQKYTFCAKRKWFSNDFDFLYSHPLQSSWKIT